MSEEQRGKDRPTVFDDPAFSYRGGVRLREVQIKPSWLPYWERMLLVLWLLVVAFVLQNWLDVSLSRFQRAIIAVIGAWGALIGMGIARRRTANREAIRYHERVRRRRVTVFASTVGVIMWVLVVYWLTR